MIVYLINFELQKSLRVDTEHIQVYSYILTTFSLSETVFIKLKIIYSKLSRHEKLKTERV